MANKKRRLQHVPRKALQAAEVGNESELYFRQQQDTPVEHCIDNVGILLRAPPRRLVFFFYGALVAFLVGIHGPLSVSGWHIAHILVVFTSWAQRG